MNGRGRFAPYVLGTSLLSVAAAALLFTFYALAIGDDSMGFLVTLGLALPLGMTLRVVGR